MSETGTVPSGPFIREIEVRPDGGKSIRIRCTKFPGSEDELIERPLILPSIPPFL